MRWNQGLQHLADVAPTSSGRWAAAGCCTCSRITASLFVVVTLRERYRLLLKVSGRCTLSWKGSVPLGCSPILVGSLAPTGTGHLFPGTVVGSWGVPMRPDHGSGRGIRSGAASPGREKVDRRGDTLAPHAHCMWHSCSIGLHRFLACCGVLMCCRFSFLFGRLPLFGWSGLCAGVATLVTCPSHAPSHTTQGSLAHLLSSGGPSFTS